MPAVRTAVTAFEVALDYEMPGQLAGSSRRQATPRHRLDPVGRPERSESISTRK